MANLERLKFLRDTVIPHLQDMPTIEEVSDEVMITHCESLDVAENRVAVDYLATGNDQIRAKQGKAILNFNLYKSNHTPMGFDPLPVSKEYDCSREGCLAGWYVMMNERDGVDGEDMYLLKRGYDTRQLRHHFGLEGGEVQLLFGATLHGAEGLPDDIPLEDTIWSSSQMNLTKLALDARGKYLDELITKYEDIEECVSTSTK